MSLVSGRVCVGLSNPKNVSNVGAVMRAAGCFAVDAVLYTGSRYDRANRFATDTKNSVNSIPLLHVDSLPDAVDEHARLVCVEFVEGANSLVNYKHPPNAFYLFGPEDASLTQADIDRADDVVFVPTVGSLNLAMCVNVVLYDRLAKSPDDIHGLDDEIILRSRDCRNRLKVSESPGKADRMTIRYRTKS